ncbi:LINE-1 retrotransposable element ORF2 protein [Vitis vinifera]|uniref:LINE-1 retrotransposable element ORF2 protein n=1 Tax=Vitis vinifera TaxID=29760 RepID=A0A438BPW4_VITVI|nr:LINE-1 retrotransposable element ORF2 protein [Vitis vinifera]
MTASPVRRGIIATKVWNFRSAPDSGDVTLDTCDDAIPYFVMDRKEGPRKQKNPKRGTCRARIAQTGRKGGWRRKRVAGKVAHAPSRAGRKNARWAARGWVSGSGALGQLEISSRRSLRCRINRRRKVRRKNSPEKFAGKVAGGTDGRNEREREREMIGLRYGQKDLAGMSDGLNMRFHHHLTERESELKTEAKEVFKNWVLLEETHWRQSSRELWLREGDKNTGFFHRMANAHRRNNSMDKIKINGRWLEEEREVREGVVNAFQQLLSEDQSWKSDIEGLQLQRLSHAEAEGPRLGWVHSGLLAILLGVRERGNCGRVKEFFEDKSFAKSLNSTFLVLIPKKGGAEDLGDFRPISLLGGKTDLDASLIANEVIDYWFKRKEKGLICKLDIEKAYDSINWNFLMKVMRKMGFGDRWMKWIWWCISTASFSILVNGVPAGYFPNSRGLRQGDPLSSYLFVLGMEVLSAMLRRAVDGGFILGCNIQGRGGLEINVSHLLFADDTIIFCEARQDHITYLSWILVWFEAASGLRINLAKSEVILVGEVEDIEMLAVELGCKVGTLPSVYLGLPLGAKHKAMAMWDGVEARMRRRLALWKRQYLSKGGRITLIKSTLASMPIYQLGSMERKIHLINWEVVCTQKESGGGLGIRKIDLLNKALLGKWIWRFAFEEDFFWKKVVGVKYGQLGFGWRTKEARGTFGVGVWRDILKESSWCWDNIEFKVGKGTKVSFWTDHWCGNEVLSQAFPQLFALAVKGTPQ